jgi:DNA-binding response OmpR family regulator
MPESTMVRAHVAVFEADLGIARLIHDSLEEYGFRVIIASRYALQHDSAALDDFLRSTRPGLVIWDIGVPYEENWQFFHSTVSVQLAHYECLYLVMTTQPTELADRSDTMLPAPILFKPFSMEQLIKAVVSALAAR